MPCWHIDEKIHSPTSVNIRKPLQLEGQHVHWEPIAIKIILHLNHNYCNNPMKKNNLQNQINSNGVNDDNVYQCANTIN